MLLFKVLVAALASGLGAFASELPVQSNNQIPLAGGKQSPSKFEYKCFAGDVQNYPSPEKWPSWEALWDVNREQVLSSNGGDTYLQHYIQEGVLQVASDTNTDARLILAVIMQETKGVADAQCIGAAPRCGIMQAAKGSSFVDSSAKSSVEAMIREGAQGSAKRGPGLSDLLKGKPRLANVPVGNPYAAARAYNSGEVGKNLDVVSRGQPGYVNDIANRLQGWNGMGKGFKICG